MDILIKNIEMPQEGHIEAYIWCNGTVTYRKKIDNQWDRNSTTAVALPEHGDLIDEDEFRLVIYREIRNHKEDDRITMILKGILWEMDNAPVIVEATE